MEASAKDHMVMVPSTRFGGLVEVDFNQVLSRLQKSQRQIEQARRRAEKIERILFKSFTATAWLWVQQGGKCPYCGRPITWKTGWSKHHIIPRSQGGSDALLNLQLMHPDCHPLLHQDVILEQDASSLNLGKVINIGQGRRAVA